MGNPLSYIKSLLFGKKGKVLMLGLDAAGKTTILYQFKLGLKVDTVPTMGFTYDTVQYGHFCLNVWDVAGQDSFRGLWKHYYQGVRALVFVVDSSDKKRLGLARDELHKILGDEDLRDVAVLVLANKIDLEGCRVEEVSQALEFNRIFNPRKKILGVSAVTRQNLDAALAWLAHSL